MQKPLDKKIPEIDYRFVHELNIFLSEDYFCPVQALLRTVQPSGEWQRSLLGSWTPWPGVFIFWQPMKPTEDTTIEVTDARPFDYYWISREMGRPSPNGQTWAAILQPTCLSIYNILCIHANAKRDHQREAFPSYSTIARECGISRQSAIDGIAKLIDFGFIEIKPLTSKYRTNIFVILPLESWRMSQNAGRKARKDKGTPNPKRQHQKQDSQSDRLSKNEVMVNKIDSDSQSDRPLTVNKIDSDSQSDRPEEQLIKKSHSKESQEERESQKSENHAEKTDSLSLSSSPSWQVFCLFFKEESKRLSDYQRNTICSIEDSALLKQAIEHLLGNGYTGAWNKISLIKKVMQELAAAASVQPGASGAASPALLDERGNPKAFTMRAKQARANMAFFDNILTAAATDVIDIQPLVAIAGA